MLDFQNLRYKTCLRAYKMVQNKTNYLLVYYFYFIKLK